MMHQAFLSLGTNIGNREKFLHEALLLLDQHNAIEVKSLSSIYETEPVGFTNQDDFLNMVAEINTSLEPQELLKETTTIEKALGRKRIFRWGPRTIDIDILLFDRVELEIDILQIPHPRLIERAFVLVPLAEIHSSNLAIPGAEFSLTEYIQQNPDKEGVRLWKQNNGEGKFGLFES